MSKKVTIPNDGMKPFVVMHNGEKYVYAPGQTVDVPDGVALEIEEYKRKKLHGEAIPPFGVGGGSGGASSWNDLEDKPFYVQSEQKEVIPPTAVQPISSVGWAALGDGVKLWASYFRRGGLANPEKGKSYKAFVGLDNNLIEFEPISAHESDEFVDGVYAGNLFLYGVYKINNKNATKAEIEAMGYVDNGESFFYGTAVDFPNAYIITTSQFYPNLNSLTRVSVEQCEVIKTLDPKYLPEGVGSSTNILRLTKRAGKSEYSCNMGYADIVKAVTEGTLALAVFCYVNSFDNNNEYIDFKNGLLGVQLYTSDDYDVKCIEFVNSDDEYWWMLEDGTITENNPAGAPS